MSAFEDFLGEQGRSLERLAFLLCGDVYLAQDLTQEVLAKCYRRWTRIQGVDHPTAYVRQIMFREFLSWRRRASVRELIDEDLVTERTQGGSGRDRAQRLVETDAMWQQLSTLPKKQRAVLVLRYYLDQSDAQAAETLKCSESTVRSNAARGLAALCGRQGNEAEEVTW